MKIVSVFFLWSFSVIPVVFAGKAELTSYYPAQYGEYTNLKSTNDSYFATSSGNVGVGTTSPQVKLHVTSVSGASGNSLFTTSDFVSMTTGSLLFLDFGATSGNTYTRLSAYSAGGSAWNNLILQSGGGSVGIGTTSPVGKLDVRGSLASIAWTAPTFGTGWSNYAAAQPLQYKKFGDFVFLRGLVTTNAGAWATYTTITTLPAGYRPPAILLVCVEGNSNAVVRLNIDASGNVVYLAGGAGSGWISLEGISFSVDS